MNTRNFELWLGLASVPSWDVTDYARIWELHLALRCVICNMVSARALSVVANRTQARFPDVLIMHGGGHVMEIESDSVGREKILEMPPYLLVFGDDHVRGTREQVMMQVELDG
ncbi:hypothetical protein DEO72_LG3g2308 [Vigna unguiculata]|uniref:Uncharacterized protein n=1 Tax=Vigna unguiculata TaxID=3917 RepID=A0A4D6LGX4_VIGUN|nr:hypothetical protein DEO72_LG3g2308 [Vigna unguiculata]